MVTPAVEGIDLFSALPGRAICRRSVSPSCLDHAALPDRGKQPMGHVRTVVPIAHQVV